VTQAAIADDDGRVRRSARSRDRIVAAMIALIRAGDPNPSAAAVAEAAGVGLRTVFRQFDDMDALYLAISARTEHEVAPILAQPFTAPDWRGRMREMLARRAKVFEHVMPLKIAGALRRHQSPVLAEAQASFVARERASVMAVAPPALAADAERVEALVMATSFEAWRRLREDQGLDPGAAERVTCRLVDLLLSGS